MKKIVEGKDCCVVFVALESSPYMNILLLFYNFWFFGALGVKLFI